MRGLTKSLGIIVAVLLIFVGCDEGKKVATTPFSQADCYAYGTCTQTFGPNAFGYQNGYPNFSAYNGQVGYQNGFNGCGPYQYPIYYPNRGYACADQRAFNQGGVYQAWNYQPSSYEFMNAHSIQFPSYYSYNYSYAFQGCMMNGYNSACACRQLYGVPSQFGVCGFY